MNIDAMTTNEWLAYRESKLDAFYAAGGNLSPSVACNSCDAPNDYVCFSCECTQLDIFEGESK
jgi:hypothetical protein